ncbi:sporulation associated protein [Phlyctema vagabunda]|uniref:Sporulation associated protein n=1 Tax=Phlyctema vagabunda TaxID=108571 RepID=A0ABR4PTV1_9HELO
MSDQATKDIWARKSYPAQSCTEQASHDDWTAAPEPQEQRPQLPTTIRAVRDSRSSYPGGRNIIICLDGTGDKFDNDNSNVVNFVACLKKDDPSQVTYYQSGIGTYDGHGLKNGFSAAIDMAVGSGLGIHIKDAYRFLMQNYREGDKICLLGFSRGSYTVRCLAGMLHKVGLLPAHNRAQVSFAYNFYKDDTPDGWKMSAEFKKTFCTNVEVYFVGVWDCVASVGFIPRKLPFSKSPTSSLHYFRHAMALDEHRAKFKICQWQHQDPAAASSNTIDKTPRAKIKQEKDVQVGRLQRIFGSCFATQPEKQQPSDSDISLNKKSDCEKQEKLESQFDKEDHTIYDSIETDVLEVWFAGGHADIGGGAVANQERHMLSRIPLRWMIRQCFECDTGILFGTAALAEIGIDVPTVWPIYKKHKKPVVGPSPGMVEQYEAGALPPLRRRSTALGVDPIIRRKSEAGTLVETMQSDNFNAAEKRRLEAELLPERVEDHFDAIAPINDQLEIAKAWWVLEFWPVKVRIQKKGSSEWEKVVRLNMGRFRAIREIEPKMHWSVQARMTEKRYEMRNRVDTNAIWQTVA